VRGPIPLTPALSQREREAEIPLSPRERAAEGRVRVPSAPRDGLAMTLGHHPLISNLRSRISNDFQFII
jgi:hypothetical protein